MSIILGTLERLEAENPPLFQSSGSNGARRLPAGSGGLPKMTLAVAALSVIAGAGLMLWLQGEDAGRFRHPVPVIVAGHSVAAGKPDHLLSPVSTQVHSTVEPIELVEPVAPIEPVEPVEPVAAAVNSTTPPEEIAVPAPDPEPVVVAAQAQPFVERETPEPDLVQGESVAVDEGADTVITPDPDPVAAVTETDVRQTVPSSAVARAAGVGEVIENARLSLSRGLYQQAVTALDSLEPVPADRADFWLIKGSAHLGMGQLDLAETAFVAAQALAPDNAQIGVQVAVLKQEKGDHAGAVQILEDLAMRHADVPEVFLNLGYSQQALGAQRQARSSFRTFLDMTQSRSLYSEQRRVVSEWLAQGGTDAAYSQLR